MLRAPRFFSKLACAHGGATLELALDGKKEDRHSGIWVHFWQGLCACLFEAKRSDVEVVAVADLSPARRLPLAPGFGS